jgi:4-amino-4-deoxy-L-arabinose transferase-like glycosyltransferase
MLRFITEHKLEFAVFSLAVVARLVFFFVCLYANGGDLLTTIRGQDGYFQLSKNLFEGNGFSINSALPFLPYSYGVPGYPYFLFGLLWLTGSYAVTIAVQILLGALIPILGMYLTRRILPSLTRAPLVVGLLLALAPYQILFSFIFYTETLFTVIFGIFLILFLKFLKTPSTQLIIFSGFFLGVATLIKPTVEYLPIVAIAFVLWRFRDSLRKEMFIKLGIFSLVFLMVLSPWLYRNYTTFGVVNLSSQMPFNLYGTLLPSVLALANHSSFNAEQAKLPVFLDSDLSSLSSLSEKALTEIVRHPVALIELSALNSFTFFTHDGMLTFLQAVGVSPSNYLQKPALLLLVSAPWQFIQTIWTYMHTNMALIFVVRIFWIAVTICFAIGLYKLFRARLFSPELLFSVIIVFYFMLTTMVNGLSVNARFRMPVEPIILAVAYAGLMLSGKKQQIEHA